MILAIETSCDDTCAAVLTPKGEILSNVIASQLDHSEFGGVVPEIASRQHLQSISLVIDQALAKSNVGAEGVELVAATQGPGLIGALLVGMQAAKAFATTRALPFLPVDHLYGHIAACFVEPNALQPPFLCLIASGGHTLLFVVESHTSYRLIGQTLDDAAGEAFDKGARMLGLGYPGGPALSKLAESGDPTAFAFPTGSKVKDLDFSFSGLKTALLYKVRELSEQEFQGRKADLAASYQQAIVEALLRRIELALEQTGLERLSIGGGVAANGLLRERVGQLVPNAHIPARELCTDNAAMIASAARYLEPIQYPDYLQLDAYSTADSSYRLKSKR